MYHGKKDIIASLAPLQKDLQTVRINRERLSAFCAAIEEADFPLPAWDFPFIYSHLDNLGVDYIMLMNALNFCYWGTPKWSVVYDETPLDGAWAMFAALKRAIDEKIPIHDGMFLATAGEEEIISIFRGHGKIPLLKQRVAICREVGRVLVDHFNRRFHNLVEEAGGSAVRLVRLLVSFFPSFDDSVEWNGIRLLFYKRAQLAPAMLFEQWKGTGAGQFMDIEEMTASADYKIPQVLRRLGILEYSSPLAKVIEERRRIPSRSREELEIRTATIFACELMLGQLKKKIPKITSQSIDRMLWYIGQKQSPDTKPYHLTLTTYY